MIYEKSDNDLLIKALMGYVIIICILIGVFPKGAGRNLAITLTNSIVPIFFLALGGLVFHYLAWFESWLKTVLDRGKTHE